MNTLMLNNGPVTMTSLEIVDFINEYRAKNESHPVQLRHSDFMAKVPKVLGIETSEKFRSSYLAGNGEQRPCYKFVKREACLMAMSYSYELQAIVFDRMTAMEEALKQPKELTRKEILLYALQAEEEKQVLQNQVALLEPKAQALDTIANTEGTYTIRECAKTIGIGERKLISLLIEKKWIYREEHGRLQPYSTKREAGIFINRPSPVVLNKNTGEEKVHLHMRITASGLTKITELVNSCKHKGGDAA
ncbi:phage antirepressor KilAC domain-containing protein [Acinetobacter baumannii]|uniref:phage antirepressor KilAC domain-containing protein n=1 Tax=Acinetobacter baumannii TaxID=470 RepID=UPI001D0F212B|nr:phage antirepressor KilAC domain-containing protein [Acinetobacter baumannii]